MVPLCPGQPVITKRDPHRGRRSYLMCDGRPRGLEDDYQNANNQWWLSISAPWSL